MTEESPEIDPEIDTPTPEKKRVPFRLIAIALVGVLAVILVLQNTETVETRLLFATVAMPGAVLLVITFLLGVIVGLLVPFIRKHKRKA